MITHTWIEEETKATSQHQITIPKKIWTALKLETGTRFYIALTEDKKIMVTPKSPKPLDLSEEEWRKLVALAHSHKNVSKSFKDVKKAISHLRAL